MKKYSNARVSKLVPQFEHFHPDDLVDINKLGNIAIRWEGEFAGRAFCLNTEYDWTIGWDKDGFLLLIPFRGTL
jgi:hypothetical protein